MHGGVFAQAPINLAIRLGVLESMDPVSSPLKHVCYCTEGRAVTRELCFQAPEPERSIVLYRIQCESFVKKLHRSSGVCVYIPAKHLTLVNLALSFCYLHVGTMVRVFAVLCTGIPTSDTDYHTKGMPFPSRQNIITSISRGMGGI